SVLIGGDPSMPNRHTRLGPTTSPPPSRAPSPPPSRAGLCLPPQHRRDPPPFPTPPAAASLPHAAGRRLPSPRRRTPRPSPTPPSAASVPNAALRRLPLPRRPPRRLPPPCHPPLPPSRCLATAYLSGDADCSLHRPIAPSTATTTLACTGALALRPPLSTTSI
uniref:Uncharacterized protein n=1 Tax=Aegilops tauschii subsp. strangulata TaxID=200361 RepID=A0A453RTF2_AEGTS